MSNCPKCKSCEIVDGVIGTGGSRDVHFFTGDIKWSKFFRQPRIVIQPYARCCTACGLLWKNLSVSVLKKFILTNCNKEFISEIYEPGYLIYSKQTDCLNCGSKRKIKGDFLNDGMSEPFRPDHMINRKFMMIFNLSLGLGELFNCCIDCGMITTRLNPKKLNRFLIKNCEPDYLKQIYSHYENSE